jgi:hypothetical protein
VKGQVLVNCGAMGLDPATLSLSGYLETMAAHEAASDPKANKRPAEVSDGLRRFMKAHDSLQ